MKRNKKLFMAFAIFCSLMIFAFRFDGSEITWLWEGAKTVTLVFGVLALFFGALWMKAEIYFSNFR